MTQFTLRNLQASIQDKTAFTRLEDYNILCLAYLEYIQEAQPTRIISPNENNYIFFQYSEEYGHKITAL